MVDKNILADELSKLLGLSVDVLVNDGELSIVSPFGFPDGDYPVVYIETIDNGDSFRITDRGHTLFHLDMLLLNPLRDNSNVFKSLMGYFGVKDEDGELVKTSTESLLAESIREYLLFLKAVIDNSFAG